MPFPAPFAEAVRTPRLLLRVPMSEDGCAMAALINANLEHLRPWMAWAQAPQTAEQQAEVMHEAHQQFLSGADLMYRIELEGALIGSCGIHRINWQVPCGDVGYWIDRQHEGRGYVTEAARALTELALRPQAQGGLGFERLEIRCDARNHRSAAVPKRLGYQQEALLRRSARSAQQPSELRDTLIFATWPSPTA